MALKQAYEQVKILQNQAVSQGIYALTVACKREVKAGQFFMLKGFSDRNMLPRPISIYDRTPDTLTFLYAVVGKGTSELATKKVGDGVDVLGPLGNGFRLPDPNTPCKIALVAGGIGIAPFPYLAKAAQAANRQSKWKIDLYAGFRKTVYGVAECADYVSQTFIATNDGSVGQRGFVTDLITDTYDYVYCCGPTVMMKALQQLHLRAKVYLSLENRMACGIGACLACSCVTNLGMRRVCKDGPVFAAEEVCL